MEETLQVQHVLIVMDGSGDTKLMWDSSRPDEVTNARESYERLKKKGYMAYRVKKGGEPGELLDAFDPEAEKIIMAPRVVGG